MLGLKHLRLQYEMSEHQKQLNTVGARIPNIQIPNTFEIRTFQCSDLEWFGFRMVSSIVYIYGNDHSKTELFKMAALI